MSYEEEKQDRKIDQLGAEIERLQAIIDKPLEERVWKIDLDTLNTSPDDAEFNMARRWHAAYRKAQNSNLLRKQEIERLRTDNAGLSKAVIDIQEERDLAQAEFRAYHKAWQEQQAELARVNHLREIEIDQAGAAERIYLEAARLKDARIQELNAALMKNESSLRAAAGKYRKRAQAAEGKIGSGDHIVEPNKLIWQITDERIRAIWWAEEMAGDCKAGNVLRAMLHEAGQE